VRKGENPHECKNTNSPSKGRKTDSTKRSKASKPRSNRVGEGKGQGDALRPSKGRQLGNDGREGKSHRGGREKP